MIIHIIISFIDHLFLLDSGQFLKKIFFNKKIPRKKMSFKNHQLQVSFDSTNKSSIDQLSERIYDTIGHILIPSPITGDEWIFNIKNKGRIIIYGTGIVIFTSKDEDVPFFNDIINKIFPK
jgi:hypothetical protein